MRSALARTFQLFVSSTNSLTSSPDQGYGGTSILSRREPSSTAILSVAELVDDREPTGSRVRDPDDENLCALADATAADVLVSGDKDLANAALVTAVVMTPRAFVDELGE